MASKGSSWAGAGARVVARGRKWVKRRIIINAGFQFRTLWPIVAYTFLFAVLAGGLVFFPVHYELRSDPDPDIQALLQDQLAQIHWRLWPMLLFAAFLASFIALYRSNRAAGPLFRLSQVLERMAEGDYRGVRFRQGDEFREFEAIANHLGKKMQALSTRNKDVLLSVESRVKQLALRLKNEEIPKVEVQTALDGILGQLDKARERAPLTRQE